MKRIISDGPPQQIGSRKARHEYRYLRKKKPERVRRLLLRLKKEESCKVQIFCSPETWIGQINAMGQVFGSPAHVLGTNRVSWGHPSAFKGGGGVTPHPIPSAKFAKNAVNK